MNNFFASSLEVYTFPSKIEELQVENLIPEYCSDLEFDLRSSKLISDKCKQVNGYATRLYCTLCNHEFVKNDKTVMYGFRHIATIIANLCEHGDYIEWFCCGREGITYQEPLNDLKDLGWELHVK